MSSFLNLKTQNWPSHGQMNDYAEGTEHKSVRVTGSIPQQSRTPGVILSVAWRPEEASG